MMAKIQKWGNSQGIRIPKQLLAIASIKEDDEVELIAEYGKIIIRRARKKEKKYTIQELFADYKAEYTPDEEEWGPPVGREEW
ncbi:AbrB/MazE/SpoVT family DNA-binding domain-containing protein [Thermincola potens]|uniref:Transcriptional regulator/antitoxin, MazE n=1 Tax=Thermincola potens (strain JR) TaxID=635013 RepID=D5XB92_THEPJ|nr:AbrB/MazE/SpoVT family DNA-binding domain-containing protein [Thermincola potens]ADG81412.1 transcriptional regulator/antitoxin, MazE [Thermincola potens JR]